MDSSSFRGQFPPPSRLSAFPRSEFFGSCWAGGDGTASRAFFLLWPRGDCRRSGFYGGQCRGLDLSFESQFTSQVAETN